MVRGGRRHPKFISTNHRPKITGRDTGVWRRLWFFPFDYTVPEDDRDPRFKDKLLETDGPAILSWIIQGAREWLAEGWGSFPTIEAATAEYREKEDVLGLFVGETCIVGEYQSIKASKLRELYEQWCRENGERPFFGRAWREALEESGFKRIRGNTGYRWHGIGVDDEIPF